jgi:anti-sigma regulatory factor (Ser/Thr protein kinase)
VSAFEHDALLYDGVDGFVENMLPFVRAGLERGDAILAVTSPRNISALRDALGADAERVDYRDSAPWYASPGKAFRGYADYVATQPEGRRLRAIGEPVWPVGRPEAVSEWARYESVLNVAFADAPAWIVCPYDAAALPDEILTHALETHPTTHAQGRRVPHDGYVATETFWSSLDERLPFAEQPRTRELRVTSELAALRAAVESEARRAGVASARLPELLLAVHELAINALTHGGGDAVLRTWAEEHDFVCELADDGPGLERRYAGYVTPTADDLRGRGLWLVRQITDIVEVRSGPHGTRIRVRVRRG